MGLLLKIGCRSRQSLIGSQSDACHGALTGKEDVRSEVSRKRRSGSKCEPKHQHQQHKTNREGMDMQKNAASQCVVCQKTKSPITITVE